MLEPGTIIKIKSPDQIKKTLVGDHCDAVYFNKAMYSFCGKVGTIAGKTSSNSYGLKEVELGDWSWHPDWFTVIEKPSEYLNDGSIEQKSLCLALVRQAMSKNQPSLDILTNWRFNEFPNRDNGGFDYANFESDVWVEGNIAQNIPNWACLKLKPEILEQAICYCLTQHNIDYFNIVYQKPIDFWFTFSETAEGPEYWRGIVNACNTDKLIINPNKTIESNETELQNKETPVRGGSEHIANRICYRKSKAQFVIRHISHQGSPFRC